MLSALPQPDYDYTTCCVCGVGFGSPVLSFRRKDGQSVWCPNGHCQSWNETEAQRLRKELEKTKTEKWKAEEQHRLAVADLHKMEKKLKRERKRTANGVCPCCHRTFIALGRHMKTKHPEFAEAPIGEMAGK